MNTRGGKIAVESQPGRAGTPLPAAAPPTQNGAHGVPRPTSRVSVLMLCLGIAATLLAASALAADPPGILNHQGVIQANGTPFNGTGAFKFALVDAAGTTTFWSNDGTVASGSQPAAAVSLSVSNGRYSVALGDTSIANMTAAIPASVFTDNADVRLRVWFDDGVHGSQQLSPDQRIASVGYALSAARATIADSVASVAAANITGTLDTAQLPASVVTNGASGVNISGTFSGDGLGLTNANINLLTSGALTWGIFTLSSAPPVGNNPTSVTATDVNGDGTMDLISANRSANTLSVLTNNGSGGFVLSSSPGVGTGPSSVTAADVNGDGQVDLISANSLADRLSVLTNNGSGGFVLSSSPIVGHSPSSVTAADVNGDGQVDLVSANGSSGTLSVLTNDGSGGFVLSSSPGVGSAPISVTAVDVNGDGQVDLISANGTVSGTLSVLTNNGSGGFVLSSSPGVGSLPTSVTAADVNGDGKMDLISANRSANTLTVLTNDGSGGFALSSSPGVGPVPRSVVAADVNGDGLVDLISANYYDNTLTVLTNNGSGGFALSSSPGVGSSPFSVTAADINGDGRVDLVSANYDANTLSALLNTSAVSGSFSGDGSGLTNLNAANITGTLGTAQIPDLDASKITSGTLGDARLSPNVALLDRTPQTFTGANIFGGPVGIGTANPGASLHVAGSGFFGHDSGFLPDIAGAGVRVFFDDGLGVGSIFAYDYSNATPVNLVLEEAGGDVGIGTPTPSEKLHVIGNILASGTVTGSSDRNVKKDFVPVNPQDVLARVAGLPISTWQYKADQDGRRHLGPMAQDFYVAFQVGMDDKHISMVDADGVALAAIQGLNQKLDETRAGLERRDAENAELKARLEKLERLLNQMSGGAQ